MWRGERPPRAHDGCCFAYARAHRPGGRVGSSIVAAIWLFFRGGSASWGVGAAMSRRGGADVCENFCVILAAGRRVNRSSLRVRASRAPRTTANRSTRLAQVGFFQSCGHFTWAGVQDAGHMVPYDRPRAGANARRVSSSPSPSFSFFPSFSFLFLVRPFAVWSRRWRFLASWCDAAPLLRRHTYTHTH